MLFDILSVRTSSFCGFSVFSRWRKTPFFFGGHGCVAGQRRRARLACHIQCWQPVRIPGGSGPGLSSGFDAGRGKKGPMSKASTRNELEGGSRGAQWWNLRNGAWRRHQRKKLKKLRCPFPSSFLLLAWAASGGAEAGICGGTLPGGGRQGVGNGHGWPAAVSRADARGPRPL
jgi:hypothetical protein